MSKNGWIGVDLDGTVAHYGGWKHHTHIGDPVPFMLARVMQWLKEGTEVRIFTARAYPLNICIDKYDFKYPIAFLRDAEYIQAIESVRAIQDWCIEHVGESLPVTNVKDYAMIQLWDDRAVGVELNTGVPIGE